MHILHILWSNEIFCNRIKTPFDLVKQYLQKDEKITLEINALKQKIKS